MPKSSYLLFIDQSPVNEEIKSYFAQFNIAIVEQQNLHSIPIEQGIPVAILIHWSILKNELSMVHQFYTNYPVPLLVIHDQPDEEVCIKVLEAGADDFIIKPIYPRELHARVSAINRRVSRTQQQSEADKELVTFGTWRLDPAARRVFNIDTNHELSLSAGEYDLLLTFTFYVLLFYFLLFHVYVLRFI